MNIEFVAKFREIARMVVDLEARVKTLESKALEGGMPDMIPESIVKRVVEQMRRRDEPVVEVAVELPVKRKPGRPRKV